MQMIPEYNLHLVRRLKNFIAEDAKTARGFLKKFGYQDLPSAEISLLNEHSVAQSLKELLEPLMKGQDVGLMSDAGCPGIADPGAEVVALAHQASIQVVPLVGPSSIVLSIMASGFTGQNFAFVGYLPVDKGARSQRIRELETLSYKQKQAQFFIETPYRNEQLFEALMSALANETRVFVGCNIGSNDQFLRSETVAKWKKVNKPSLHKVPVVFGIYK